MRWPWAPRPKPPRFAEVLERLSDVEHAVIVLEGQLRKLHFRMMSLKSAEVRRQPEEETAQDAPGEAIPLQVVSQQGVRGTGPLRNLRGF